MAGGSNLPHLLTLSSFLALTWQLFHRAPSEKWALNHQGPVGNQHFTVCCCQPASPSMCVLTFESAVAL